VSPAIRLWTRVGVTTAVSLSLLLLVSPRQPALRMPWVTATVAGLGCGVVLYVAATRCRPLLPAPRGAAVGFGTQAFLVLLATNEEIVWRRVVLGELLDAGFATAMVGSTVGFALVHRSRRSLHLGTGFVFGALYVTTGALAASVAAHWLYNALVGALVDRRRLLAEGIS
jgi:membrane protease YdiL (CAAX protease family)